MLQTVYNKKNINGIAVKMKKGYCG